MRIAWLCNDINDIKRMKMDTALLPILPTPDLKAHEECCQDYPADDWRDVSKEAGQDYLLATHAINTASINTADGNSKISVGHPAGVRQASLCIEEVDWQQHEHAETMQGTKDQNRNVHVLVLKNW